MRINLRRDHLPERAALTMATDPPSYSPQADQDASAHASSRARTPQVSSGNGLQKSELDLSASPEVAGRVLSRLFNAGHGLAVLRALSDEGFPLDASALRHWLVELSTPLPIRQTQSIDRAVGREVEDSLSGAALEPFGEGLEELEEAGGRVGVEEGKVDEQNGSSIDLQNLENERILHQVGGGALEDAADALDRRNMRGLLTGSKGKGELLNLKAFSPPSGRYRNGAEIAVGGSGRIRLAEDRQLSRRVIVKELRRGRAASPHAVRRLSMRLASRRSWSIRILSRSMISVSSRTAPPSLPSSSCTAGALRRLSALSVEATMCSERPTRSSRFSRFFAASAARSPLRTAVA